MPWSVVNDPDRCSSSRPWAVVKDDDGSVEGCHATKGSAQQQQAALYASEQESESKNMSTMEREGLIRMNTEMRAEDDGRTLTGYAAVFDRWTEINSWEGHFRERIARGAFKRTLQNNRNQIKVLFNHGMDPTIGDKPLGKPRTMREDDKGLYVEVPLDETSYNSDIIASLRSGALDGMSFRMTVIRDEVDRDTDDNLPERTIQEVRMYEFGPVTFPAYEATEAGVRAHAPRAFEAFRAARQDCPQCAARDTGYVQLQRQPDGTIFYIPWHTDVTTSTGTSATGTTIDVTSQRDDLQSVTTDDDNDVTTERDAEDGAVEQESESVMMAPDGDSSNSGHSSERSDSVNSDDSSDSLDDSVEPDHSSADTYDDPRSKLPEFTATLRRIEATDIEGRPDLL